MPAGPGTVEVEVHRALGDYLWSVGALHPDGEVAGGVIPLSRDVLCRYRGTGVSAHGKGVLERGAVTLHERHIHLSVGVSRVLDAEVGYEVRAAGSFGKVEGGNRVDSFRLERPD